MKTIEKKAVAILIRVAVQILIKVEAGNVWGLKNKEFEDLTEDALSLAKDLQAKP